MPPGAGVPLRSAGALFGHLRGAAPGPAPPRCPNTGPGCPAAALSARCGTAGRFGGETKGLPSEPQALPAALCRPAGPRFVSACRGHPCIPMLRVTVVDLL